MSSTRHLGLRDERVNVLPLQSITIEDLKSLVRRSPSHWWAGFPGDGSCVVDSRRGKDDGHKAGALQLLGHPGYYVVFDDSKQHGRPANELANKVFSQYLPPCCVITGPAFLIYCIDEAVLDMYDTFTSSSSDDDDGGSTSDDDDGGSTSN